MYGLFFLSLLGAVQTHSRPPHAKEKRRRRRRRGTLIINGHVVGPFWLGLFVKRVSLPLSVCLRICRGEVERLPPTAAPSLLFVTQTNPTPLTKEEEEDVSLLLPPSPLLAYINDVVMIADRQILFYTEPPPPAFVVYFPSKFYRQAERTTRNIR